MLLSAEPKRNASVHRHGAQPVCQLQQTGFGIPQHPDQACLISCFVDGGLAKTTDLKATTFQTEN